MANTAETKTPEQKNDSVDYGFDQLEKTLEIQTSEDVQQYAKNLRTSIAADFWELEQALQNDSTLLKELQNKRKELNDTMTEYDILFQTEWENITEDLAQLSQTTINKLTDFAQSLDAEFGHYVSNAQENQEEGSGYSFGYKFVEKFIKTDEQGETQVFGIKISDVLKFMEQFGISLGWIKSFVPEIWDIETKSARKEVQKAFSKNTDGVGQKYLNMTDVKDILERRDTKIAENKTSGGSEKITYTTVIKDVLNDAKGKIKNLTNLCKAEGIKLSFNELVKLSEISETKAKKIAWKQKSIKEYLTGTLTIWEKVENLFAKEPVAKMVEFFEKPDTVWLTEANKDNYQTEIKKLMGTKLKCSILSVAVGDTGRSFVVEGAKGNNTNVNVLDDGKYKIGDGKILEDDTALEKKIAEINQKIVDKIDKQERKLELALSENAEENLNKNKEITIGKIGQEDLKLKIPGTAEVDSRTLKFDKKSGIFKLEIAEWIDAEITFQLVKDEDGEIKIENKTIEDGNYDVVFENNTVNIVEID